MASAALRLSFLLTVVVAAVGARAALAGPPTALQPLEDRTQNKPHASARQVETIQVVGQPRAVVSGTKTPTALIDNPMSISVVDRAQLDLQAPTSVPQAMRYVPGLATEISGADNRVETSQMYIRGFNPNEYIDGLRLQAGSWATPQYDTYDLERIDVVRGPDSVLYGQASPGGLIALTSKTPTDTPQHQIDASGGSWRQFQLGLDTSDRLNQSGSVTYRVVAFFRNAGTQVDHTELRRFLLAPSLKWRIDPDTTFTLLTSYQADPEGGFYNQLPYKGTLLANPNGPIPTSTYLGEPDYDRMRRNQFSIGYAIEHRINQAILLRQNFRYQTVTADYNAITLDSLAANNIDANRDAYQAREVLNTIALDNQIQATYRTGPLQHVTLAGIDYQHEWWDDRSYYGVDKATLLDIYDPLYTGYSGTAPEIASEKLMQDQTGLYAQQQITWRQLHIVGGVRGDFFDENIDNRLKGTTTNQSQSTVTGRIGAIYTLPLGIAPYVNYSTSFQPQTGVTYSGTALSPATAQQIEVGVKYRPKGIDGFLTVAFYDLKEQNVVTNDPVHTNFSIAAGAVRSRGVEVEGHYRITRALRLLASYTFLDQKITQKVSGYLGTALPAIPRQTASMLADYTVQSGPLAGLGGGAGVRYQGISFANYANTYAVPDVTLFDLNAHYDLGARFRSLHGLSAQLNISNLTDRRYISACVNLGCYYGLRRDVLGSLRYRW